MKNIAADWSELKYKESPFFLLKAEQEMVNKIYTEIEKGVVGDWAISKALLPIMTKHKLRLFTGTKKKELERLHGTSSKDLNLYSLGLITPLILINACFTWHLLGRGEAESLILNTPEPSKQYADFRKYLSTQLPICTRKLASKKNCLIIFEHARQRPFDPGIYFRTGTEASHDAFLLYAGDVARLHNAIEYGYKL